MAAALPFPPPSAALPTTVTAVKVSLINAPGFPAFSFFFLFFDTTSPGVHMHFLTCQLVVPWGGFLTVYSIFFIFFSPWPFQVELSA